jgi:hypothetical protein
MARTEHADLAVRDLPGQTGVLTSDPAGGFALLEKACLIDHQDRIVIRQMLDDVIAHDVAQRVGVPSAATQDRLLPPAAGFAFVLAGFVQACTCRIR